MEHLSITATDFPSPVRKLNRSICVAPMLDLTDRHCRYFHRLLTRHALLYTEMVTTGALLQGDRDRFLSFNSPEQPLALQLGGSNPTDLAVCAKMAEDYGFVEVNLNLGCPSDRVQNGRFGACLMAEPALVAECVAVMSQAVTLPITVKMRIGIDRQDSYQELAHFVSAISKAGCRTFIIHARKAWLKGLSPKQNREIPPLRYDMVEQLKLDYPHLEIILNGGITNLEQAEQEMRQRNLDGIMIGRAAYHNPYILAAADARFYADSAPVRSRREVVHDLIPYIHQQVSSGVRLNNITRHILGLFHGQSGAKAWCRHLSENSRMSSADAGILRESLALVQE